MPVDCYPDAIRRFPPRNIQGFRREVRDSGKPSRAHSYAGSTTLYQGNLPYEPGAGPSAASAPWGRRSIHSPP